RVLAALSGDEALAAAAGTGDLYEALAGAFDGARAKAKIALLSAMYGGAGGEGLQLLAGVGGRVPAGAPDGGGGAPGRGGGGGGGPPRGRGRAPPPPGPRRAPRG